MAFLQPDYIYTANGLTVKRYYLTEHNPKLISMPSRRTLPLLGLTIHNTNDINEAQGTTDPEQYVRSTQNGNMGTVRVHFYVDDVEAWQMLPLDWQSWHAGQKGKSDANGSQAGNAQTISIECIMYGDKAHKDLDEKAEDNAARLIAYLLDTYGMTIEKNLFTHNYWCNIRNGRKGTLTELNKTFDNYKGCPVFIRPHWDEFCARIRSHLAKPAAGQTTTQEKTEAKTYLYNVVVGAYGVKENADRALKEVQKVYPDAFIKRTVKSS